MGCDCFQSFRGRDLHSSKGAQRIFRYEFGVVVVDAREFAVGELGFDLCKRRTDFHVRSHVVHADQDESTLLTLLHVNGAVEALGNEKTENDGDQRQNNPEYLFHGANVAKMLKSEPCGVNFRHAQENPPPRLRRTRQRSGHRPPTLRPNGHRRRRLRRGASHAGGRWLRGHQHARRRGVGRGGRQTPTGHHCARGGVDPNGALLRLRGARHPRGAFGPCGQLHHESQGHPRYGGGGVGLENGTLPLRHVV